MNINRNKKKQTSRRYFIAKSMLAATGVSLGFNTFGTSTVKPSIIVTKSTGRITTVQKEKIKICIFSKHLQWLNYSDMAETAAKIGFDGIDLTVRPQGHVLPERVADDLPKAVEAVREAGLEVNMLTTTITDPRDPHTEAILKTASQLGIGYYRIGYLPYKDSLGIADNLKEYIPQLRELAEMNKQYNIHGAYQNHSGTNVGAPVWDLWILLKDIDPRWLGCQYDVKHATVEGGYSWPLGLKLLNSHIKTTDIKDFHWIKKDGKWRVKYVPLGEGMVDFKTYFELIKQYGISGPISIHFEYPLGGADKGVKELTIEKEKVTEAMKKDLMVLRRWLKEADL